MRDQVQTQLDTAGAIRMQEAMHGMTGDSWQMLACVDRMVELHELVEIPQPASTAGQHRVFVRKGR